MNNEPQSLEKRALRFVTRAGGKKVLVDSEGKQFKFAPDEYRPAAPIVQLMFPATAGKFLRFWNLHTARNRTLIAKALTDDQGREFFEFEKSNWATPNNDDYNYRSRDSLWELYQLKPRRDRKILLREMTRKVEITAL